MILCNDAVCFVIRIVFITVYIVVCYFYYLFISVQCYYLLTLCRIVNNHPSILWLSQVITRILPSVFIQSILSNCMCVKWKCLATIVILRSIFWPWVISFQATIESLRGRRHEEYLLSYQNAALYRLMPGHLFSKFRIIIVHLVCLKRNMLFVIVLTEFKFDGFSSDTCRSLVAMKDVRVVPIASCLLIILHSMSHKIIILLTTLCLCEFFSAVFLLV